MFCCWLTRHCVWATSTLANVKLFVDLQLIFNSNGGDYDNNHLVGEGGWRGEGLRGGAHTVVHVCKVNTLPGDGDCERTVVDLLIG